MLGGGISASTSDHSHHTVTYLFWYGCAGLFVTTTVVLTRVIERRRLRESEGQIERAGPPVVQLAPGSHEVRDEGDGRTIVRPISDEEARPPSGEG
jgi:hypothetical protein